MTFKNATKLSSLLRNRRLSMRSVTRKETGKVLPGRAVVAEEAAAARPCSRT